MAKSHETRQFSYMQVVDGPIVTFTLARFFFFSPLFAEERGKTREIAKLSDATISTEPHWRIGAFAKLVEKRNPATKSLSDRDWDIKYTTDSGVYWSAA